MANRPLRILQVLPRYAPAWAFGGGVRMGFELGRQWVRTGHKVTVFTSDEAGEGTVRLPPAETLSGIEIERFPVTQGFLGKKLPALFFRPRGLREALRRRAGDFDVIHVAESRGPHTRWTLTANRGASPVVVWSAYGGLAEGSGVRKLYRRVHDWVYQTDRLVARADRLVAQTRHEAEVYRQFGALEAQIVQIPLAVAPDILHGKGIEPGKFRARFGIPKEAELVAFVGRLHRPKGLQMLIPAFADVHRVRPQTHLAIVGWDQGFEAEARSLVRRHKLDKAVTFAGPVLGDERFSVYRDADVFSLTPGIYEETSLAALEACGSGTPCVITKQCEIPGIVESGGGLMVDYDRAAIAASLTRILAEGGKRLWGPRARELIESRFTAEVVAAAHIDLFNNVVAHSGQTRVEASRMISPVSPAEGSASQ